MICIALRWYLIIGRYLCPQKHRNFQLFPIRKPGKLDNIIMNELENIVSNELRDDSECSHLLQRRTYSTRSKDSPASCRPPHTNSKMLQHQQPAQVGEHNKNTRVEKLHRLRQVAERIPLSLGGRQGSRV